MLSVRGATKDWGLLGRKFGAQTLVFWSCEPSANKPTAGEEHLEFK